MGRGERGTGNGKAIGAVSEVRWGSGPGRNIKQKGGEEGSEGAGVWPRCHRVAQGGTS